jgi:hypothetical protein
VINNTKCHFETNDNYINKNKNLKKSQQINKNYKYIYSDICVHGTQINIQIYNKYILNNKIKISGYVQMCCVQTTVCKRGEK